MTQQYILSETGLGDAGRHYTRLRHMLGLVEQIAGRDSDSGIEEPDEPERINGAYEQAPPIARRRFDTLVSEVSAWASSGVDALAAVKNPGNQPRIAAARLADEIDRALGEMKRLLRV